MRVRTSAGAVILPPPLGAARPAPRSVRPRSRRAVRLGTSRRCRVAARAVGAGRPEAASRRVVDDDLRHHVRACWDAAGHLGCSSAVRPLSSEPLSEGGEELEPVPRRGARGGGTARSSIAAAGLRAGERGGARADVKRPARWRASGAASGSGSESPAGSSESDEELEVRRRAAPASPSARSRHRLGGHCHGREVARRARRLDHVGGYLGAPHRVALAEPARTPTPAPARGGGGGDPTATGSARSARRRRRRSRAPRRRWQRDPGPQLGAGDAGAGLLGEVVEGAGGKARRDDARVTRIDLDEGADGGLRLGGRLVHGRCALRGHLSIRLGVAWACNGPCGEATTPVGRADRRRRRRGIENAAPTDAVGSGADRPPAPRRRIGPPIPGETIRR